MKTCRVCKLEKTLDEFYRDRGRPRGECKECSKAKVADDYRNKPGRREAALRNARISRFRRVYGMTIEDYDRMLEEQDGRCKMCRSEDPKWHYSVFAVDHDHKTGKVRGLLCYPCNMCLGYLEDHERMMQAGAYLSAASRG